MNEKTKEAPKPISRKVSGGLAGGAGGGVLIAWIWGMVMPESPMPPEVAAVIGPTIGALVGFSVRD